MEESLNCKKYIKVFILIAVIVRALSYSLLDFATNDIDYKNPTLVSELMLRLPAVAVTGVLLALFYAVGKKLTGNNIKSILLMGSVFFGIDVVNAVTEFLSCSVEAMLTLGYLDPGMLSLSTVVISIIEIPFAVIAAYYAFTAFEGLNSKLESESLEQSKMPLSRARTRYFAYDFIGSIVIGFISTLPAFVISFLAMENVYTDSSDSFIVIATQFASAFGSFAGLVVLYIAGYKPFRSRTDAMAFVACSSLSAEISSIFVNLLLIPQMLALNSFTSNAVEGELELESALLTTGTTGVFSVLTISVSIGTALFMLKYFFSHKLYCEAD